VLHHFHIYDIFAPLEPAINVQCLTHENNTKCMLEVIATSLIKYDST